MRALIATLTAGGGHLAAAGAVQSAWEDQWPQDTVDQLDLTNLFSPLNRRLHREGYLKLVEQAPELWGAAFKRTDSTRVVRQIARVRRLFPTGSRLRFLKHLQTVDPDLLVCTHYMPVQETRPRTRRSSSQSPHRPRLVCVVTDFEAHALWLSPHVDLYCVAAESTKAGMVDRGVPADRITVTGIPIAKAFAQNVDPAQVRETLQIKERPTLLVLGGGFGMGPVEELLGHLEKVREKLQLIVVAGRNEELRRRLQQLHSRHCLRVLGFASNMHELMTVSDLVVSKPGGLTTSESLALGKPLLIYSPIPGQETANARFLTSHRAGLLLEKLTDAPSVVADMLQSAALKQMSANARLLGKPGAARQIAAMARAVREEPA